jgi:uncharacterized protein
MHPEMYDIVVPEFKKLLQSMKGYFDKATQHAETKKYDVTNLLTARLSPDQYDLAKQVHVTCFLAEECIGRLAGKVPPKYEGTSKNTAELKIRIDHAINYLNGFKKEDFQGWEERPVDIFFAQGKFLPGYQYLTQLGIPNFHFHLVTVYSILRHNGVEVGKMDYLGPVNFLDKK